MSRTTWNPTIDAAEDELPPSAADLPGWDDEADFTNLGDFLVGWALAEGLNAYLQDPEHRLYDTPRGLVRVSSAFEAELVELRIEPRAS